MISEYQINELVDKIVVEYEPEKIYLFGSYADSTANKDSDIDLLVIKKSTESRLTRITDLKMRLLKYRFKLPIDLLVYPEKDLLNENFGKFSFIYNVLKSGKLLYEN